MRRKVQSPSLEHLAILSDDVGIIQHAVYDVPNRTTGYCTDDVARAFMVAVAAGEPGRGLAARYLAFLYDAQLPDGRYHNFMGYDRNWQDAAGGFDAYGRALWAAGYGTRFAPSESWRRVCWTLLERSLAHLEALEAPRPRAYAIFGLVHAYVATGRQNTALREGIARQAAGLARAYDEHHAEGWSWFEETMTYDNARLPEALLQAGWTLNDASLIELGARTLAYYETVTVEGGVFVPIGNDGWYPRGGARARYSQQPLEAAALVDAALIARTALGDLRYEALARTGLDWFLGRNTARAAMVSESGGCRDGIDAHGVNENMGAESTLAYLASAIALARMSTEVAPVAQ
ncbi:MAG TPA: hypothetical protein VN905_04835 [Candidatus Binatia bacterium]|nr:hypothetical protein [Candidatus Binatia bacterium]